MFAFNEGVIGRLRDLGSRRGLTGFALTEHIHANDFWGMHETLQSQYRYSKEGFYDLGRGFRMLSGCEVTVGERVDFIVVGPLDAVQSLDDAFSPKLSESYFPPALQFLDEVRKRGLVVISAHPFRPGKETAKLPLDRVFAKVHAIEVNGRDHGTERRVAALAEEYDKPVSGGSDAHYYLQVGIRSTVVPQQELNVETLARSFGDAATRAHCKRYAPSVVELCQQVKRVVKARQQAEEVAA
jgi:histidinol phosphatase-like PHP family hydrolase